METTSSARRRRGRAIGRPISLLVLSVLMLAPLVAPAVASAQPSPVPGAEPVTSSTPASTTSPTPPATPPTSPTTTAPATPPESVAAAPAPPETPDPAPAPAPPASAPADDTPPSAVTATSDPQPIPADLWDVPAPVDAGRTYVVWEGDPGDPIAGGGSFVYTQADSQIVLDDLGATGTFEVDVQGDSHWSATLRLDAPAPLTEGYYDTLALRLDGEGRGCTPVEGWLAIDRLERTGDTITLLEARAGQSCGDDIWLHTEVRWVSSDPTTPPGPTAPPAGLWDTNPLPADRTYLVIDADQGDIEETYTQADALFNLGFLDDRLWSSIEGEESFSMDFAPMLGRPGLEPGYYGDLQRYPFHNPARGGIDVNVGSSGCNELTGWFMVDDLLLLDGVVERATIRFGQVCDHGSAVQGKLHWVAADPTAPPGPQPIPEGLWDVEPDVGAGQTYVALQGVIGEAQSDSSDRLYTKDVSTISVVSAHRHNSIEVTGEEDWGGEFSPATIDPDLVVGYYPDPQASYRNPTRPTAGFGDGRATCADATSWMAVDEISRDGDGELSTLTLRFESRCGEGPPLHVKIRYRADDPTSPPPPAPIPPDLWDIDPGLPAGQTYVAVDGRISTKADAHISVRDFRWFVDVSLVGDEIGLGRVDITPGYHPNVGSGRNPTRPTLVWQADSTESCPDSAGWLAVDEVTRDGNALSALTFRFEYRCPGSPAVRGKVHWVAADPTEPPGPVTPVPDGLWDAAPLAATSTWAYVDGQPDDGITGGTDQLVSEGNGAFEVAEDDGGLAFVIRSDGRTTGGVFLTMSSLDQVEQGFYADLRGIDGANPAKGALVWRSLDPPSACLESDGWVAVDHLVRVAGSITELTLRFEQVCAGRAPLHGKINVRTAPPPVEAPQPPIGHVDSAGAVVGNVYITGWALDPNTSDPIAVHVYVDGVGVAVPAIVPRPDVAAAYPGYGDRHGFAPMIPAAPGPHTVCAYGIDSDGGGNSLLGCRQVVVPGGPPMGALDLTMGWPSSVRVSGWAIDPDTRFPIDVHLYVDGAGVAVTADGSRPDVGQAYPEYGADHGYRADLAAGPGTHEVCAYGINTGLGHNVLLGCRWVVVPGGSPFGNLDVAVGGAGSISVAGWAIDPDTRAATQVHVYVDGRGVALDADGARPDVGQVHPGYGDAHGFAGTIAAARGSRQVCAYAINVGVGGNALIACRTVTVS